ncbi:MAG: S-layer homology domain-containing protein [Cyanobacteria bacterium J06600_6]
MTNQSPQESQDLMPERRKRPATGVTFDEMIAIIVAFTTIGTILFWAMGNKSSKLAGNFGLGGDSSSLLSSGGTTDTGLGFGSVLSGSTDIDASLEDKDLEKENRRLAAKLQEQDQAVAYIPPSKSLKLPEKVEKKSFSLDSSAKLAPLAGVATLPALVNKSAKTDVRDNAPSKVEIEKNDIDTAPVVVPPKADVSEATTPEPTETAKVEPKPVTPETTKMPEDVVPDYWAYPFVKQMRDKALVPELAKNQEFDPDALITRASMATLVSQAFEGQPATESIKKFSDVSNKNAIAKDIDKAVSTGFMQGYSDDEFKPLENIPRYQVLVTLATGLGLKPSKDADQILQQFGDSSEMPDWAKQQVAAATEAGLVVNPPDTASGSLVPEKSATRGEVAAMIHQALVNTGKLEPIESEYIVKP